MLKIINEYEFMSPEICKQHRIQYTCQKVNLLRVYRCIKFLRKKLKPGQVATTLKKSWYHCQTSWNPSINNSNWIYSTEGNTNSTRDNNSENIINNQDQRMSPMTGLLIIKSKRKKALYYTRVSIFMPVPFTSIHSCSLRNNMDR